MSRERIKTLILSVLVMMSVVITQKLWFDSPKKTLNSEAVNIETRQIKMQGINDQAIPFQSMDEVREQVITPQKAIVSFGEGYPNYYTVLSYNDMKIFWDQTKLLLNDYFIGDPEITAVSFEEYKQSNQVKYVELEFANSIPSILISSLFDMTDSRIVRNIKEIKKILIPASNKGMIYIDAGNQQFYEIKLENYEDGSIFLPFIENLKNSPFVRYYPIFADVENYTIIPINYNIPVSQIFVESEINVNDERALVERSKTFFNENFDFVKTIRETSGTMVYMYGYGEKGVRINNRGRLEYYAEVGASSGTNVIQSLDAALDFILKHGDFPSGAYLKEVKSIQNDQNKGYYFGFGYRIENLPVDSRGTIIKNPIEIEVYGTKIKSYRTFIRKNMNLRNIIRLEPALPPFRVIEKNIKLLEEQYLADNQTQLSQNEENNVLKNIELIGVVYFDTLEETHRQLLIPSWKFKVNNRAYFFDIFKGELLHSSLLN